MPFLLIKRLTAAAALVAMLALQLSGGAVHYLCDCTGEVVFTAEEHCHNEHGELGPIDHAPVGHQHHDDDHQDSPADSGSHHHHELVETPTDTVLPKAAMAPAITLSQVLWIEVSEVTLAPKLESPLAILPPPDTGGPPSLPLLVVQSVVFLI